MRRPQEVENHFGFHDGIERWSMYYDDILIRVLGISWIFFLISSAIHAVSSPYSLASSSLRVFHLYKCNSVEMIRRQSIYFIKTLMQSLCLVILVCMAPCARPFVLPSTSSSSPSSLVAPLKGAHRDLNPHSTASSSSRTPSTSHCSNLSSSSPTSTFDTFASFITAIQREIIQTIEVTCAV